jgi:hypothetical protein
VIVAVSSQRATHMRHIASVFLPSLPDMQCACAILRLYSCLRYPTCNAHAPYCVCILAFVTRHAMGMRHIASVFLPSDPTCNAHAPYWVCILALVTRHAMRMRHIVICGLSGYTIFFPHYLINGTIFRKMLLNIKCVFWFALQILSETFLIVRSNGWDMIKMYISLHVKYPLFLSAFNEIWISSRDFGKNTQIKFYENSSSDRASCSMRTDGWKDMTKLTVPFSTFAKAAKNK